jgi:uncharacterized protein (TIGR00369 family)
MENVASLYKAFNNLDKQLDFELTVYEPGKIQYRVVISEKHLSSPGVGHGAVTAALMDAVLGTSALSAVYEEGNLVSTVEFKLNYFKPALLGDELIGTAEIEFKGKSLIATSGKIVKKHNGELVSKGMGTFNIYPMSKRGLKIEV